MAGPQSITIGARITTWVSGVQQAHMPCLSLRRTTETRKRPFWIHRPLCSSTPHADRIMIETTATDMSISITPCDTHAFLGKLDQALELTSTTCTVTSEHTIELIKLWHARLGDLSFKRLQAWAKLHPSVLRIPLQTSFNEICHCCQRSSKKTPVGRRTFRYFYLQRVIHCLPDRSRQPSRIHLFPRQEICFTKSPAAIPDWL